MNSVTQGHNHKNLRLDSWLRHAPSNEKAGGWEKILTLTLILLNITMAFIVGMIIGWFAILHPFTTPSLKTGAIVGFMGGHTIAASFSLDMLPVLRAGRFINAKHFIAYSVLFSLIAFMSGIYVMRLV